MVDAWVSGRGGRPQLGRLGHKLLGAGPMKGIGPKTRNRENGLQSFSRPTGNLGYRIDFKIDSRIFSSKFKDLNTFKLKFELRSN
jgi:hypothetical protein